MSGALSVILAPIVANILTVHAAEKIAAVTVPVQTVTGRMKMRKRDEILDRGSCLSKAEIDEMIFVLLGRDSAAPHAIREWCKERIKQGKNSPLDRQILDAIRCAEIMEKECKP